MIKVLYSLRPALLFTVVAVGLFMAVGIMGFLMLACGFIFGYITHER